MIHPHIFWWRFFPRRKLTQIYLSTALRSFALSLIGIFIPIYLMRVQGFSLNQTLWFFIFYSFILAVTTPFAGWVCFKWGCVRSIFAGIIMYIIFIGSLYFLPLFPLPWPILSGIFGLSQAFYWIGLHLVFYQVSDRKHRGEEVGLRDGLDILASLVSPLLGGLLITIVGFSLVFVLVSVILLLSAAVLLASKEYRITAPVSIHSLFRESGWKDSLFFISRGTGIIAEGVIWPLFIFVIVGSYFSLGIIGSILSGLTGILLWVVGKYSDRINKRIIVRWGTLAKSGAWLLRAFVTTAGQVFAVTALAAVTQGVRESPLGALEYDKARGQAAAYFVSREMLICIGRIVLLVIVLLTNSLSGGILFQSVANLATLLF